MGRKVEDFNKYQMYFHNHPVKGLEPVWNTYTKQKAYMTVRDPVFGDYETTLDAIAKKRGIHPLRRQGNNPFEPFRHVGHAKRLVEAEGVCFWPSELKYKSELVENIKKYKQGLCSQTSYARKCEVREVVPKNAREFLTKHHLMGATTAKAFGLFVHGSDQLVAVMSVVNKKSELNIARFCTVQGCKVVGGFSKLLKHITNIYKPDRIVNWVDLRYGTGAHLLEKGWVLEKTTQGRWWCDGKNVYNRLKCKATLTMTEKQHAESKGWFKIYDAGQAKFTLTLHKT